MDRSTLSQLLSPNNDRLPRVDSLVGIAQVAQVSLDWLLGLTHAQASHAGVLTDTMQIERDALSPVDERLLKWHAEASGYKIRCVPTTFPDALKTLKVIDFEYEHFFALSPRRRIEITAARLEYIRRPESEMEVCTPTSVLEGFARAEGRWRGISAEVRRRQIDHLITLSDELYPRFRWFLYDEKEIFSAPVTIFGPIRAALYVGQMYFVCHATEQVRALTSHFDSLIRKATVQPTGLKPYLTQLLTEIR
jgi:hypothetical protein